MSKGRGGRGYTSVQKQILDAPHYFALLGVNKQSTEADMKIERRELLRYTHPDVNICKDAHQLSALVNLAFTTLTTTSIPLYIATLQKKPCGACRGEGVITKQSGFTRTLTTTCRQCKGAGVC